MVACHSFRDADTHRELPRWNGDRITYSLLTKAEIRAYVAPTVSIKYVVSGTESYRLDQRMVPVRAGNYLLVNSDRPIDMDFRSQRPVHGFCLHLRRELLNDVYTVLTRTDASGLDDPLHPQVLPEFEELLYRQEENELGALLARISQAFDPEARTINTESDGFFQLLAEGLVRTVLPLSPGGSLQVLRSSTHAELMRRLHIAREWLMSEDAPADMSEVARRAHLSPAHFFRSFRKAYGCTPYQFMQEQRLQRAAKAIGHARMSISEAALHFGFADLPSFSKAFRKRYGQPPSQWISGSA